MGFAVIAPERRPSGGLVRETPGSGRWASQERRQTRRVAGSRRAQVPLGGYMFAEPGKPRPLHDPRVNAKRAIWGDTQLLLDKLTAAMVVHERRWRPGVTALRP